MYRPCRREGHLKCSTSSSLPFYFICTSASVHLFCPFSPLVESHITHFPNVRPDICTEVQMKCTLHPTCIKRVLCKEVEKKHLKMKCNIRMKRCTRSAMMCKIRAHSPPIWACTMTNGWLPYFLKIKYFIARGLIQYSTDRTQFI